MYKKLHIIFRRLQFPTKSLQRLQQQFIAAKICWFNLGWVHILMFSNKKMPVKNMLCIWVRRKPVLKTSDARKWRDMRQDKAVRNGLTSSDLQWYIMLYNLEWDLFESRCIFSFICSSAWKKKLIERKPGKGFLSNKNSLVHIKFSINNCYNKINKTRKTWGN